MEPQEPASGGVHDTKWTAEEIAEWEEKVAQVTRVAPPERKRVSEAGVYDRRGPPEAMDYATAKALAALVADVEQWGGHLSRVLVAHDGVKRSVGLPTADVAERGARPFGPRDAGRPERSLGPNSLASGSVENGTEVEKSVRSWASSPRGSFSTMPSFP